jgi:hypothetical protein
MAAIEKLSKTHAEHMSQYGTGNEQRLTGKHETCDINTFRCVLFCVSFPDMGGGDSIWVGSATRHARFHWIINKLLLYNLLEHT